MTKKSKGTVTEQLNEALRIIKLKNEEEEKCRERIHEQHTTIEGQRKTIEALESIVEKLYLTCLEQDQQMGVLNAQAQTWQKVATQRLADTTTRGLKRAKYDPYYRAIRECIILNAGKDNVIDLQHLAMRWANDSTGVVLTKLVHIAEELGYVVEQSIARSAKVSLADAKRLLDTRFKKPKVQFEDLDNG